MHFYYLTLSPAAACSLLVDFLPLFPFLLKTHSQDDHREIFLNQTLKEWAVSLFLIASCKVHIKKIYMAQSNLYCEHPNLNDKLWDYYRIIAVLIAVKPCILKHSTEWTKLIGLKEHKHSGKYHSKVSQCPTESKKSESRP